MAILDILYLALAIAVYPGFRCLVCARYYLEIIHWWHFDSFACCVYPHHGEPHAEVSNDYAYIMLKIIGKTWEVVEFFLISTELVMCQSPHAQRALWIFPISHDPLGPDYFPYARRVVLL